MTITLDLFIQELVAQTAVPSSFGSILQKTASKQYKPGNRRRTIQDDDDDDTWGGDGYSDVVDIWAQLGNIEAGMMAKAPMFRMMADLSNVDQFTPKYDYPALAKFQKKTHNRYRQGAVILCVLRIYHTWASTSTERALANIYIWMNTHNKRSPVELHQTFAQGNAEKSRSAALALYSDCFLAAGEYIKKWNRNEKILEAKRHSGKGRSTTSNVTRLVPKGKNTGGD